MDSTSGVTGTVERELLDLFRAYSYSYQLV